MTPVENKIVAEFLKRIPVMTRLHIAVGMAFMGVQMSLKSSSSLGASVSCFLVGLTILFWALPSHGARPDEKPCRGKKCSVTPTPTPTQPPVAAVRKVVGGEAFTCVLNAGAVKCMGNIDGETNRGAFSDLVVPTQILGLESGVTDIAAGPYNLLAIKDGNLYAMGSNDYNQLAQGPWSTSLPRDIVSPILLLSGVKKADISYYHGCALMQNNDVRCWGSNFYGIFGNGSWSDVVSIAEAPVVASNAQDVFVNENVTCVLEAGNVKCAGYNGNGDIGVATPSSDVPNFVQVPLPSGVSEIGTGYFHSYARLISGETYTWGFGSFGELADRSTNRGPNYARLATEIPVDAEAIYIQNYTTCFKKQGQISCVGWNQDNVIGDSNVLGWTVLGATARLGLQGVPSDMSRGISGQRGGNYAHRCFITSVGLECVGSNGFGQLGNGTKTDVAAPALIMSW